MVNNPRMMMMNQKGNNVVEIHLDLLVMAYLQAGEVSVGVTPKERN
jgi:hypothetical protein